MKPKVCQVFMFDKKMRNFLLMYINKIYKNIGNFFLLFKFYNFSINLGIFFLLMTDIDWDLNLLKDIKNTTTNAEQQVNQIDLMLQPITTQQNFKLNKKLVNNEKSARKIQEKTQKLISQASPIKDSVNLKQQSMKFRQYLSQKVQQLRKSKELIIPNEKKPDNENKLQNKKYSTLSNIINQQESKQKDAQKTKIQTNIKKSIDLQIHRKSMQTPNLTPPLKPPLLKKTNDSSSTNDQKEARKSITIDHHSNKTQKQVHEKDRRKTPQSKNSFRIKRTSNVNPSHQVSVEVKKPIQLSMKSIEKQSPMHQSKNKRLREQFMRLNQQQRKLQQQIFVFHKQSKHQLENILRKYQISSSNFQKYGITKDRETQQNITGENKLKMSPSKKSILESKVQKSSQKKIQQNDQLIVLSPLKKEKSKNQILENQIQKLNNLLKVKSKEIQKLENKIEKNLYTQFLRQQPSDIQQELEQDQADIVQELPNTNISKAHQNFSSTYSTVMSEMKNKKWGLKQRITFETHRQPPDKKSDQKQSKISNIFNSLQKQSSQKEKNPLQQNREQQDIVNENLLNNKIQVNSRLKNLLFD